MKCHNGVKMTAERHIDTLNKFITIGMEHFGTFFEGQTYGAVTAVVDIMAGGLI